MGRIKTLPAKPIGGSPIRAELTHAYGLIPGRKVETVFFGGGTPSLMPADLVAAILADIDALWGLAAQAEISLEANPVSAPRPHLQALRAAGVTRLSLGVQAFDDKALKALGRTHSAAEGARGVFGGARTFSTPPHLTLIYARPSLKPRTRFCRRAGRMAKRVKRGFGFVAAAYVALSIDH
jgi:oxygen-independent coproporphyrinogen-3 oxidase